MFRRSISGRSDSRTIRRFTRIALTILATSTLLTTQAWCAGSKVLYSFAGGSDGANPYSSLIFDSAGNLYGTTEKGGAYSEGTVYKLSQSNGVWTETILYSFGGVSGDGSQPQGSLVFDKAGNLYGTTQYGGLYFNGTVYELTPNGNGTWSEAVLHSFNCCATPGDGGVPNSAIFLAPSGKIYGTTQWGGAGTTCGAWNFGCGTFFELAHETSGWKETVLHSFLESPDASVPWGPLTVDKAGNFYNTSLWGGSQEYAGSVFKLSPASGGTWTESVIYTLDQQTGVGISAEIDGVVFDSAGNLYGVGSGGVFELTPSSSGWTETTIFPFTSTKGPYNPYASVVLVHNSTLWGTTAWGGGGTCSTNGCGTLYRVQKINGVWTGNAVFTFHNQANGWFPTSTPIVDSSGNVYGTTLNGGAFGFGVVYEVTP